MDSLGPIVDGKIRSFGIGGYRSFKEFQYISGLGKINVFIGSNNSGKSNILKFVNEHFSKAVVQSKVELTELDTHITNSSTGVSNEFYFGYDLPKASDTKDWLTKLATETKIGQGIVHHSRQDLLDLVRELFAKKAELDESDSPWIIFEDGSFDIAPWLGSIDPDNQRLPIALKILSGRTNNVGSIEYLNYFLQDLIGHINHTAGKVNTVFVPAVRDIGGAGSKNTFGGYDIVNTLRNLSAPAFEQLEDKKIFRKIENFLKSVIEDPDASMEVAASKDEIIVTLNGRTLPIESLGSGIHEVVILAAAATVVTNAVICLEEPELHLNPSLQKKLIKYLDEQTDNQYLISTHSASIINRPRMSVYEVKLVDGESKITKVITNGQQSEVCLDMGYRPSDLVQANFIIWVEGPSDRLYIAYWISLHNKNLIEGIHYSIMFYGGRLSSHISGEEADSEAIEDFISLRTLNKRAGIVIDSDKENSNARINSTKKRLKDEFSNDQDFVWVTQGREIENYLPFSSIAIAAAQIAPQTIYTGVDGRYKKTISTKTKKGKASNLDKVKLAHYLIDNELLNLKVLDLQSKITKLCQRIVEANH